MLCPYCVKDVAQFENRDNNADGVLAFFCPVCSDEIPIAYATAQQQVPQVVFGLMGKTGHGKTCFLSALLRSLDGASTKFPGFHFRGLDELELRKLRQKLEQLESGHLPEPTAPTNRPRPLLLEMIGTPLIAKCQLLMYDVAGGVFSETRTVLENARFVARSPAILWLLSLDDLESRHDLDEFLAVYLSALERMQCDASRQTLVVALTKGDRLLTRQDLPDGVRRSLAEEVDPSINGWEGLLRVSDELRQWIEESWGATNFVRNATSAFKQVRYCINSALGSHPVGDTLEWHAQPRGVLVPLWWILRDSLPTIRLCDPTGRERLFFSLEKALEAAQQDASFDRLVLDAANYSISGPITFSGRLLVRGQGRDQTRISCDQSPCVASSRLDGAISIEGVSFEYTGTTPGDAFVVESGTARFSECAFIGARSDADQKRGGAGLAVRGTAKAEVRKCVATGNARAGLLCGNGAQLLAEGSQIFNNDGFGVLILNAKKAKLKMLEVNSNGECGIQVRENATASIEGCQCRKNGNAGIAFSGHSTGDAVKNVCKENGGVGILVADTAGPSLNANHCIGNTNHGISFVDESLGDASDNVCEGNGADGIVVGRNAAPDLDGNECRHNKRHGILLESNSAFSLKSGSVMNSQCHSNPAGDIVDRRHAWTKPWF